jgi:MoxR-like ATPase
MNPPASLTSIVDPASARAAIERVVNNVGRALLGKPDQAKLAVLCLVARGHLLLEDIPGVGKTTLAEALARSFALSYTRVQFTSDLMPADILGGQVFDARSATFELRRGPIFAQLVLADELNRAPPRTQSALLEAMAQAQVSLDGKTYPLPSPFTVVATQNPTDLAGTYPLPDSQLDRFLMRVALGHPDDAVEVSLLQAHGRSQPVRELPAVSTPEELLGLQQAASRVAVAEDVARYAVRIAEGTRAHPGLERGVSTRALLAWMDAARARALFEARAFVTPGDLRITLVPALAHRILLRSALQGAFSRDEAAHLLQESAGAIPEPR